MVRKYSVRVPYLFHNSHAELDNGLGVETTVRESWKCGMVWSLAVLRLRWGFEQQSTKEKDKENALIIDVRDTVGIPVALQDTIAAEHVRLCRYGDGRWRRELAGRCGRTLCRLISDLEDCTWHLSMLFVSTFIR
jgi:hypothetical protein